LYRASVIWTKEQRDSLLNALDLAQAEFERLVGFQLAPTFNVDEQHNYETTTFKTKFPLVIEMGVEASSDIELGAAVSHATDPAIVTINDVTVAADEIHVYHPGTSIEIFPSLKSIIAETLTLSIPRVRTVIDDNNPSAGWDYTDTSKFEQTVDVKRIYVDTINPVQQEDADGVLTTGIITVKNKYWGLVKLTLDSYAYNKLYLNYYSGKETLDTSVISVIIQLAHAQMPIEPVNDGAVRLTWLWDKDVPRSMSTLQRDCPLGQFTGAYNAWRLAGQLHMHRAGVI
jgi:hypothetical protein